ncbi:ATP-dependent DNA helicase [Trichonephila inaurata madagascariensis]|uniref:ATP-dependent DNA helicase n=1 Tax=Trichonephila inaurata madagascariensis TaxID=2747483 RepID=A0A8X7C388_9ARAC|nr:ATP-dependent DNA helicase [Trichonephila inaurata madagascariensis]
MRLKECAAVETKEVAVVIVGQEFEKRDIVLSCRGGTLMQITETHRAYDALQYPLMFFLGEDGYQINIPKRHETTKSLSARQCYLEIKKNQVLVRVYTVHPANAECYYLRLLLHKNPGPTSFTALKIVAGVVQSSFQAACRALGLLEDDSHWKSTLEEASISESPNKIRELLAVMLVFCQVVDPIKLWEKHRDSLLEDVKKQIEAEQGNIDLYRYCL